MHRWESGICHKDCTPPCSAQWKLSKMFILLNGHPLTDSDDVKNVKEKIFDHRKLLETKKGSKMDRYWIGMLPYLHLWLIMMT